MNEPMTNQQMREESGCVTGNHLEGFFYSLLRDHLVPGKLEQLVMDSERCVGKSIQFTNGYIAQYAKNITKRLLGPLKEVNKTLANRNADLSTLKSWAEANIPEMETTIQNKKQGTKNTRRTIHTPKERVQSIYNQVQEEKPFILELARVTSSAKYCKHLMKIRDLNIADDLALLHLMEILDETSDLINDHLTKKSKGVAK